MISPISLPGQPRILVITLRRLGDVLLTTPLIRSLKCAWPAAKIDMLVFAGTADIIDGNPDIDRVIAVPQRPTTGETISLATRLWRRYDLAIATQPGDRPTAFAILAGKTHAGLIDAKGPSLGRNLKSRLLHRCTPAVPDIHRVEQMLRLADTLGIARVPQVTGPAPAAPKEISLGGNTAVVHAAPMFSYKQWTQDGWRAVAAGLRERGLDVVAIGGPDPPERRYLDELWRGAVAIHRLSWRENVTVLRSARVYVGPDTSTTHLAAATGCPTVALFGPTDPRIWGPWPASGLEQPWHAGGTIQHRGNVWLVQNPLPCLPCQLEGCERNTASASACLQEMTSNQVLAAVDQALTTR